MLRVSFCVWGLTHSQAVSIHPDGPQLRQTTPAPHFAPKHVELQLRETVVPHSRTLADAADDAEGDAEHHGPLVQRVGLRNRRPRACKSREQQQYVQAVFTMNSAR